MLRYIRISGLMIVLLVLALVLNATYDHARSRPTSHKIGGLVNSYALGEEPKVMSGGSQGEFTAVRSSENRAEVVSPDEWLTESVAIPKQFQYMTGRSLDLDTEGHPHIAYGHTQLYYAWHDGIQWQYQTVDDTLNVGDYASLALDGADHPHISYYDYVKGDLKYAVYDGSSWQVETVASIGRYGGYNSLALDNTGYPHISFYDRNDGYCLKYARYDGFSWQLEVVDGAPDTGKYNALALDNTGRPHISYYGRTNDELKYAYHNGSVWQIETVDSVGDGGFDEYISLAVDDAGFPHISYYDNTNNDLKYARYNGSSWQIEIVDNASDVGWYNSLVIDVAGHPHISYYDRSYQDLKYAYYDGSSWQIATLDIQCSGGQYTSLALDAAGLPRFSYYYSSCDTLEYASYDGSSWQTETVDSGGDMTGSALALDNAGHPHISYYDSADEELKYARYEGSSWQIETVDSNGVSTSLVLDSNDHPHISYRDRGNGELKYTHYDGSSWQIEIVDSVDSYQGSTSLRLDSAGRPHIAYFDANSDDLKYARYNGSSWQIETLDNMGFATFGLYDGHASLALDESDRPHIGYCDHTNDNLKYTYYDGSSWQIETVDDTGEVGGFVSLALDTTGHPHISYYASRLKYAWHDGSSWQIDVVIDFSGWGEHTSLALDGAGHPHISYYIPGGVQYAWREDTSWQIDTVAKYSCSSLEDITSLALDDAGRPHISYIDSCNGTLNYAWLAGGRPISGLEYVGARFLLKDMMRNEEDNRVTIGDHVHLKLPFRNSGNETITNAAVQVTGAQMTDSSVGVSIYNGTSWGNYKQLVSLTPSTLAPGEQGEADFWIYVTNNDPDVLVSLPSGTWISLSNGEQQWQVSINLSSVGFDVSEPPGHERDMTQESCLHHPHDPLIKRYAQYAAGASMRTPPANNQDPDTADQAVRNVVTNVHDDFPWWVSQDTYDDRVEDTLLYDLRGGDMGKCRHYADFTVGVLRSLGVPTRFAGGRFTKGAHAWAEVSVGDTCSNGWSPADSTWDTAFAPGFYEKNGAFGTFLWGWADLQPLSSASSMRTWPWLCDPSCYEDVDCDGCKTGFNTHWGDSSCVESIRPCYHDYEGDISRLLTDRSSVFSLTVQSPSYVTRSVPFSVSARLVNNTTTVNAITMTISLFEEVSSTLPLYDVDPPSQVVTNVSPGTVITATWVVTPLLARNSIPLEVIAGSGDSATSFGQIQVVNEPGTLPPLILGGACGIGNVSPGQPITLTASVLDEVRQLIADTTVTITATIYSTPTTGFSETVSLILCDGCGHYRQVVDLPTDAPIGRYWVDYVASRSGYDAAQARSVFWVTPLLGVSLTANDGTLSAQSILTLSVDVEDRGVAVADASVRAAIVTPSGTVTVPLTCEGSNYIVAFRVSDLSANLSGQSLAGDWHIRAMVDYLGGYGSDALNITVVEEHRVYLPLVLSAYATP